MTDSKVEEKKEPSKEVPKKPTSEDIGKAIVESINQHARQLDSMSLALQEIKGVVNVLKERCDLIDKRIDFYIVEKTK